MERIVKGIYIPLEIWEDTRLSDKERTLLMEVDSFTSKGKPCYFSNEWIAKRLGVSERTGQTYLKHLIDLGLVVVERFDGRHRYIASDLSGTRRKLRGRGEENCEAEVQDFAGQRCNNLPPTYNTSTDCSLSSDEESHRDTNRARERFVPPTLQEVSEYCASRNNGIDPAAFIDHYTSNGWKVGKSAMKDWRAAVRNWERNHIDRPAGRPAREYKSSEARKLEKIKDFYKDYGIDIPEL